MIGRATPFHVKRSQQSADNNSTSCCRHGRRVVCHRCPLAYLYGHYETLRLWNRRLSLIGPGTTDHVLDRHYGEALAAAPLIRQSDRVMVDIGSGAGFPGFVLSALFPSLSVWLVEARQRKWSFLRASLRKARAEAASVEANPQWPCFCVNARIEGPLPGAIPDRIDVVTSRAVRISPELLAPFLDRSPGVRFLLWQGEQRHRLPTGAVITNEIPLPGGHHRTIIEVSGPQ